jgi:hypothetical protein
MFYQTEIFISYRHSYPHGAKQDAIERNLKENNKEGRISNLIRHMLLGIKKVAETGEHVEEAEFGTCSFSAPHGKKKKSKKGKKKKKAKK